MYIVKGDKVRIMKGKDRGKEGVVTAVLPKAGKVVLEGINIVKKHMKSRANKPGGIIEVARPMSVANVRLLCPKTHKPTKIKFSVLNGEKLRLSTLSGEVIPYPSFKK